MDRRGFLAALLAASVAPAYVKASSLMPILVPKKEIILPPEFIEITINSLQPSQTFTFSCWMKKAGSQWEHVSHTFTADANGNSKAKVAIGSKETMVANVQLEGLSKNPVLTMRATADEGFRVVPSIDYSPPKHYKTSWFDNTVEKISLPDLARKSVSF